MIIIVRQHKTGADLVQISLVKADYPESLLRKQIAAIGDELGSAPRGVSIGYRSVTAEHKMTFLRAEFAVDGLIERDLPALRVQPLIRAFAGMPKPYTIEGINILFDGEKPTDQTVRKFRIDKVLDAEARFIPLPRGIEYQVHLLSQNPQLITFPEKYDKANEKAPSTPSVPRDNRVLLITLFGIASLALGALVYFAMLRGGPKKDAKKR